MAIASGPGLPASLKQQFLFVDRIGVVDLDSVTEKHESLARTWPHNPFEILRLRDAGLLFPLKNSLHVDLLDDPEAGPALAAAAAATRKMDELMAQVPEEPAAGELWQALTTFQMSIDQAVISRSYVARAYAVATRRNLHLDAVSLLPIRDEQTSPASRDEAIRIVIRALPTPSEHVPPLEIIRFREDPENHQRLLALRAWASDIARGKLSPFEIEERLVSDLATYERNLVALERKHSLSVVELVLSSTAEVIANLKRFNFGSAVKALFSIDVSKATFLKEELQLPGRAVSYVQTAQRQF